MGDAHAGLIRDYSHTRFISTLVPLMERLRVELISGRRCLLPALVVYGTMVDPATGKGGIPCLWRLVLGISCPGCGLSRADALLVRGHFAASIAMNWLIIPTWLVAVYVFVEAFIRTPIIRSINR